MKQFLELFNPFPENHYLHVTTSKNEIEVLENCDLIITKKNRICEVMDYRKNI